MIRVAYERWQPNPLTWIHRAEARAIAAEFESAGIPALRERFNAGTRPSNEPLLLRLSDPVMLDAARTLTSARVRYIGPGAAAIERCYDKLEATRIVRANGTSCPDTWLANDPHTVVFPAVVKPRRGSDSIGVRIVRHAPIPGRLRTEEQIVQPLVRGTELTVAVLHGHVGHPLRIFLPEGTPYSFCRKYLFPPRRGALEDEQLVRRVRSEAGRIAQVLGVDWAARIDFILESGSGRLVFLECDVAPLIGTASAFAASLSAGGMGRQDQLRLLVGAPATSGASP